MKPKSRILSSLPSIATLFASTLTSALAAPPPERVTFDEIWGQARSQSPSLTAQRHQIEAAETAERRASRHWAPRLRLSSQVFATNDPAAAFVNTLQQRAITATDFAPTTLNTPGQAVFSTSSLGVDLPLFEGGQPTSQSRALHHVAEATRAQSDAGTVDLFATLANAYGVLLSLEGEEIRLKQFHSSVAAMIERYQLGSRSNPVGHAGMLALRALKNRVAGLLEENRAKKAEKLALIGAQGVRTPGAWSPLPQSLEEYIRDRYPLSGAGEMPTNTPALKAAHAASEAAEAAQSAEKARFLPRVGLFAQGNLQAGDRATATNYATGAYLQWSLFSATDLGAGHEAEARAAEARSRETGLSLGLAQQAQAARTAVQASRQGLVLIAESESLLEEQRKIGESLFRTGALSALQWAEILNRQVDLSHQRTAAEGMQLDAHSQLYRVSATNP